MPATLIWVEALDKGDIRNAVPHRDRIVTLAAPFTGEPAEVARTEYRYGGVSWTDTGTILLTENDRASRTTRTWVLERQLGRAAQAVGPQPAGQLRRSREPAVPSRAGDDPPGRRQHLSERAGRLLGGRSSVSRSSRPPHVQDRARCSAATRRAYETVVGLLDEGAGRVLTRRETRTAAAELLRPRPPRRTQSRRSPSSPTRTRSSRRPWPIGMFVTYKRKDGVGLSGTIYLPVGYQKGQRVPMLVWAYPQEFADADAASQVVGSPNRFTTVTGASHLLLLTQGYAVFDGPTMPIVGTGRDGQRQLRRAARGERRGRDRQGRRARHRRPRAGSPSAATATARS